MKLREMCTPKNLIALMLCVGLVQIAAYYFAAAMIRPEGGLAIGHPDTPLYCQAARRIAEGVPFSYSEGTAASTGTTSVLYPFVLAVPYLIGFRGDSLLTGGFLLNAAFYLVFLAGWGAVVLHVFANRPYAQITAAVLIAFFGQSASCALVQTDIGLWMAVSAFLIWGLVAERRGVFIPLLLVAPWVRPEGMVVVVSFGVVLACRMFARREFRWVDWLVFCGGVVSVLGVFALNLALTGHAQFASVVGKGYFTGLTFAQAVYAAMGDLMELLKAYLLGLPSSLPRNLIFLPLLGAVTLWLGVWGHDWRRFTWREGVVLLAFAGSAWTVSTSSLQDKNLDRYLAWGFPIILLFIAEGCEFVAKRSASRLGRALLASLNCGFTVVMAIAFICIFHFSADRADRHRAFAARCEQIMEKGRSVGVWSEAEIAYEFSSRRLAHLCGVYSPEFLTKTAPGVFEILKREPKTRFDYYFFSFMDDPACFSGAERVLLPKQVLMGPDGHELRRTDWQAFDLAEKVPVAPKGKILCDRVDVAYEKEEESHEYGLITNYHMPEFRPFIQTGKLRDSTIVEGGRVVFGGDEMTVHAQSGKDLHIVMRTYPEHRVGYSRMLSGASYLFSAAGKITMNLAVNGRLVGNTTVEVGTNGFSDVAFSIPGSGITSDNPRIAFLGDHIACGYWFYQ